jgi:hypothetical protein
MVVNFKIHGINRDTCKLTRYPIKLKKKNMVGKFKTEVNIKPNLAPPTSFLDGYTLN